MAVAITMACGCKLDWDGHAAPVCAIHNETRVQHVTSRPPRFKGTVTGPCAVKG